MIFPQLPHSSRTEETQDSLSSPGSPSSCALAKPTGSSSQKTQRRHLIGRSPMLSSVMLARRRDTWHPCDRDSSDAGPPEGGTQLSPLPCPCVLMVPTARVASGSAAARGVH